MIIPLPSVLHRELFISTERIFYGRLSTLQPMNGRKMKNDQCNHTEQRRKKAVIDLSAHSHEMYKSLRSMGGYVSPERLRLRDEEGEEYRVKLYSGSEIGSKDNLLLTERDSLYDAYMLDLTITNAREEIKDELEQNLLHGQYSEKDELLDHINEMKIQAADRRLTFYCLPTAGTALKKS